MPSDLRWTGGIANRDWVAGHPVGPATDRDRLKRDVAAYLTDCRTHQRILNRAYHPTTEGALKIIHHHAGGEQAIRDECQHLGIPDRKTATGA